MGPQLYDIDAGDVLGRMSVVRVCALFSLLTKRTKETQVLQAIPSGIAFGSLRDTLAHEGGNLLVANMIGPSRGSKNAVGASPPPITIIWTALTSTGPIYVY